MVRKTEDLPIQTKDPVAEEKEKMWIKTTLYNKETDAGENAVDESNIQKEEINKYPILMEPINSFQAFVDKSGSLQ